MIVKLSDQAITQKGKFSIVLAGGNTPQKYMNFVKTKL